MEITATIVGKWESMCKVYIDVMQQNATYPDAGYPDRLVENSTKITCLVITGYQVRYSAVLELLELEIRRDRKVQAQVRTVNSNCRTSNCKSSLFSKKNPCSRIFSLTGCMCVPINPDKWRCAVLVKQEPGALSRYRG